MRESRLALVCAVLFAAQAAVEIAITALAFEWPSFTPESHIIGLLLAAAWLVAAVCALKKPVWGWFPLALGSWLSVAHGFVVLVPGNRLYSLIFLLPAIVTSLSLRRLILPHRGVEPLIRRHLTLEEENLLDRWDRRLSAT